MTVRLKKPAQELLVSIFPATAEAPFRIENVADVSYTALVAANFIQARGVMGDDTKADVILSDAGKDRAKTYMPAENPRAPTPEPGSFVIKKLDKAPEITRQRGGARTIYPFAELTEPLMSFFVPATDLRPKPWETMRSTVGTQNKKLKEAADEAKAKDANAPDPWIFDIYEDTEDGKAGARIYRKS